MNKLSLVYQSCRKVYFIICSITQLFESNSYYYCYCVEISGCSPKLGGKNNYGVCIVTSYYSTYDFNKIKFNPIKLRDYIEIFFADLEDIF